jgi:hypothetical protein
MVVLAVVVIVGLMALAFIDVAPPQRLREITVPPERVGK